MDSVKGTQGSGSENTVVVFLSNVHRLLDTSFYKNQRRSGTRRNSAGRLKAMREPAFVEFRFISVHFAVWYGRSVGGGTPCSAPTIASVCIPSSWRNTQLKQILVSRGRPETFCLEIRPTARDRM